ncbi:MAG: RluA family pseudouridine synthase [Pseudomonadota bacterium]
MPEIKTFEITPDYAGFRLDKAAASLCPDLSRARLQALIAEGALTLNGQAASAAMRIKLDDVIVLAIPEAEEATPQAQDIALDIVYEDDDILVLNKQAGLVVHPGAGHHDQTLVNALLHHCGDSLSGIGGVKRPGIVHRLDKDTTGLMLVAKNDMAHRHLSDQLQDRSLSRTYWAMTVGQPIPQRGVVDQPIGRHKTNRQRQTITRAGRDARTHYQVIKTFGARLSLIECALETGRTHQIRVHMAYIKCPLLGDSIYGAQQNALRAGLKMGAYETQPEAVERIMTFPRQALHARTLVFIHPRTEEEMEFTTPELPEDFGQLLKDMDIVFSGPTKA